MRRKGFTLLELLVAVGISTIIGAYIFSIMVGNNNFSHKENAIINEGMSLNDVTREIDNQIRQASAVAVGYPESNPLYTSGEAVAVLKIPSLGEGGIIKDTYDFMVMLVDEDNPKILRMKIFPDPLSSRQAADRVMTVILDSVQFTYFDKNGNTVDPVSAVSVGFSMTGSNRTSSTVTNLRNN